MARVYNFSAGPSMLPEDVLKTAAEEMLEYGTTGQSVMEMSHRSKEYQAIFDEAEANLREIMNIPDNYKVLFLQGGASTQFAMIPLNLMNKNKRLILLLQVSGLTRLIKRRHAMVKHVLLHQVLIRPIRTFQRQLQLILTPRLTLFIFV